MGVVLGLSPAVHMRVQIGRRYKRGIDGRPFMVYGLVGDVVFARWILTNWELTKTSRIEFPVTFVLNECEAD